MSKNTEQKPLGFGQTMLASAVGVVIAFAVLNIIAFIICMGLLVSALSSSMEQSTPITGSNLAVELDLTQTVSERKLGGITSLFGEKRGTSIEQLLTTMENASVDDRVKAIYLHLGGSTLDWAQAEELKDAVVRFHNNCDKPILAYGDAMTQPEYYLATNANLLAVHPSGVIEFKGMGAEAIFYKGLLDKLGVHMELIRPTSCTYKSAGETYVRTNMSDANREQVRSYINSIWDYAVESMAANRGLRVQQLNTLADNLSGFLPDEALLGGLVDTLCFEQDIKQMMHDNYGVTKIVKANRYAENVRQTKTKESTDQIALIYAEGFFSILDSEEEVEPSGSYRPEKIHGRFELKDVDFTYPNGNQALFGVNMVIEPGKITALVGLSGAGKSTIVNLLDKFYVPQRGTITLDGVDLKDYDTKFLRDNVGLVLQKNHIFDGTVEENILYGKPDATHEEVIEAAKKSFIYDQIMALPKQFKNKASDLSGGQQQRIAIARMFLKNPPIIFLDEPTASLDAIATEQIKNSIDAIKEGRTVIIISHNISQIIDSELVYALQKGRVEQYGNPDEVYRKGGVYKDIIDASARSLNIEKIAKTVSQEA